MGQNLRTKDERDHQAFPQAFTGRIYFATAVAVCQYEEHNYSLLVLGRPNGSGLFSS